MSLLIILSFSIIEPNTWSLPLSPSSPIYLFYLFFATVISLLRKKTERKEKKVLCLLLLLFLSLWPSNLFEQSSLLPLLKMIVQNTFPFFEFPTCTSRKLNSNDHSVIVFNRTNSLLLLFPVLLNLKSIN